MILEDDNILFGKAKNISVWSLIRGYILQDRIDLDFITHLNDVLKISEKGCWYTNKRHDLYWSNKDSIYTPIHIFHDNYTLRITISNHEIWKRDYNISHIKRERLIRDILNNLNVIPVGITMERLLNDKKIIKENIYLIEKLF